jgi:aquaporin Z
MDAKTPSMARSLRRHWPEYLMEAALLGLFMVSAACFAALIHHPDLPVRRAIESPLLRRALMGAAMGLTALALVFSPWGQRSGAHFNPSITLTYLRLGKIESRDALFYVLFQFAGGLAGILIAAAILGELIAHPAVNHVATLPGEAGIAAAFVAEAAISFILMSAILSVSNTARLARFTPFFAAALVATFITVEDPFSGMSMNPARSFAPAAAANLWTSLWIYFTAPPLGMLLAAEVYVRARGVRSVICAKLHHENGKRCIFRCGYAPPAGGEATTRRDKVPEAALTGSPTGSPSRAG